MLYNCLYTAENKNNELAMSQAQLQETVSALSEAEQTLASYSEMEAEWRSHNEKQEEKIREMSEFIVQRDQELSELVAAKDKLHTQLHEKSESLYIVCLSIHRHCCLYVMPSKYMYVAHILSLLLNEACFGMTYMCDIPRLTLSVKCMHSVLTLIIRKQFLIFPSCLSSYIKSCLSVLY